MKKDSIGRCVRIMMLCSLLVWISLQSGKVMAETLQEVTIKESDYTDSRYYPGFSGDTDGMTLYGLTDGNREKLRSTLKEGLLAGNTQIDVRGYGLSSAEFQTEYIGLLQNDATLFFVKSAYRYYSENGYVTIVLPQYTDDKDEADEKLAEMDAVAEEAVKNISADMTAYEKALVVHDWLAVHCAYDYDSYKADQVPQSSHTAYGALVNRAAVCDGYAKAYAYIMQQKLEIPCIVVASDSMSHAWNMIKLDGQYYHTDVTWDDPVLDKMGYAGHDYFLKSDAQMKAASRPHTGWVSDVQATDGTTYGSAQWNDTHSSVIRYGDSWYYVQAEGGYLVKTTDLLGTEYSRLAELDTWNAPGNAYYTTAFSYLQKYGTNLYYNGAKAIYRFSLKTEKVQTEYLPTQTEIPADTSDTVYNIYGFRITDGILYYLVYSSPNRQSSEEGKVYHVAVTQTPLQGELNVQGEMIYGKILTAEAALEEETDGEILWQWKRNHTAIPGAAGSSYQLTAEDIGTVISVEATAEGYSGSLEKTLDGTVEKAPAEMPENIPDGLNGVAGETLQTVQLPEYWSWKEPDQVLEEGTVNCQAEYCRDTTCYEVTRIQLSVTVSEKPKDDTDTGGTGSGEESGGSGNTGSGEENGGSGNTGSGEESGGSGNTGSSEENGGSGNTGSGEESGGNGSTGNTGESSITGNTVTTDTVQSSGRVRQQGTVFSVNGAIYRVCTASADSGTLELTGTTQASKHFSIPDTVLYDGITYKVTSVGVRALRGQTRLKTLTVGKYVTKIRKEALYGCRNLKKITINSGKLRTVEKNAIGKINKKASVFCPSSKYKAYRRLFMTKKSGYKKTMRIRKK